LPVVLYSSAALKTHTNLNINLGTINEDGEEEEDGDDDGYDPDDLADDVSQLSMDEYSFDTVTTAFHSEVYKAKKKAVRAARKSGKEVVQELVRAKISGNTKLGLPYLLDLWRDCISHPRISVQVQMLSGEDIYMKVFVRVSTDGKELVLTLPMSPYLARSDFAFNSFLLAEQRKAQICQTEEKYLLVLLKHHPKCAARMVAASKVKGRSNTEGFFYEQRIPLPRKVQHEFASSKDGDDLFVGKKFVKYPDGSVFLHVELIAECKDNYIPEERMLDPTVVKMPPKMQSSVGATPMETEMHSNSAYVLHEETKQAAQSSKRQRVQDPVVETVTAEDSDDDADDSDDDASNVTGPAAPNAAAAAAAQAEAQAMQFAEEARNKAAAVLQQADHAQPKKSSLQAAAEQGHQ